MEPFPGPPRSGGENLLEAGNNNIGGNRNQTPTIKETQRSPAPAKLNGAQDLPHPDAHPQASKSQSGRPYVTPNPPTPSPLTVVADSPVEAKGFFPKLLPEVLPDAAGLAAFQREHAKRYRGGRMDGGTSGWGFDGRRGSDEKEEPVKTARPTRRTRLDEQDAPIQADDDDGQWRKNGICDLHDDCYADLDVMSKAERKIHRMMHQGFEAAKLENISLKEHKKLNEIRLVRDQDDLQRVRFQLNELYRENQVLFELIYELEQQIGTKKIMELLDKKAVQSSKPAAAKVTTQKKKTAKSKIRQETPGDELPEPGLLPEHIQAQAAEMDVFDHDAYDNKDLEGLWKAGYRYCNVCGRFLRGRADFESHAPHCNTTPWNFVTKAHKDQHKGVVTFAARFQPPPPKISGKRGRSKSRQPEGERAWKLDGNEDPDPIEEFEDGEPRPRRRRKKNV